MKQRMHIKKTALILILSLALSTQSLSREYKPVAQQLKDFFDHYSTLYDTGDAQAIIEQYADDPNFYWAEDGRIVYRSKQAVAAALKSLSEYGTFKVTYKNTKIQVLSPTLGHIYTEFTSTINPDTENSFSYSGAMSANLKLTEAGWKFISGHTSSHKSNKQQ